MKTTQGSSIIDSNHPRIDSHFGVPPHSAEISGFNNRLSLNTRQLSSLTYDEDKAQCKSYLQ